MLNHDLGKELAEALQQAMIAEVYRPTTVALLTTSGRALRGPEDSDPEWSVEVYGEFEGSEVVKMEGIAAAHNCGLNFTARRSNNGNGDFLTIVAKFYELPPVEKRASDLMVDDHDRRLAEALEDVGYPESIVAQAREGHWSDFKSPLGFPKLDLGEMLRSDGHEELRQRVMQGEFDG